ncbi:MAG: sulfite exporter TauE/SafE family protein [Clostridia bacterium]|nr:sulfite exporter TauE/SafE family protein [Clostridia bacterium]
MEMIPERENIRRAVLYALAGLAAGFINGLAGTGAGVVFLLLFGIFGGGMTKTVFSVSMACVIPLSVVSLITYPPPERAHLVMLPWIFVSAILGGLCGAWLQRRVNVRILKLAFAGLVIWAGIKMML